MMRMIYEISNLLSRSVSVRAPMSECFLDQEGGIGFYQARFHETGLSNRIENIDFGI